MNNSVNTKEINEFWITSERSFPALRDFLELGLSPLNVSPEALEIAVSEALDCLIPRARDYLNGCGGTSKYTCYIGRTLPECTVSVMLTKYTRLSHDPFMRLMCGRLRCRFFTVVIQRNLFFKRTVRLAVSVTK